MKKKIKRQFRINKILRPLSVWLLMLLLMLLVNFDSACYLFNHSEYKQSDAVITEVKTDPYLLLIPMVELQYTYNGCQYKTDKFFVVQSFFHLSKEAGTTMQIYINVHAPEYVIFKTNFFINYVNWILMFISICCLVRMYRRICEPIRSKRNKTKIQTSIKEREDI